MEKLNHNKSTYKYCLLNLWSSATDSGFTTVSTVYTDDSKNERRKVLGAFRKAAQEHSTNKATAHLWDDAYVVVVYDLDYSLHRVIEKTDIEV